MHIFFYLFIFTEYLGILLGITNHIANGRRRLGTKETVNEGEGERGVGQQALDMENGTLGI